MKYVSYDRRQVTPGKITASSRFFEPTTLNAVLRLRGGNGDRDNPTPRQKAGPKCSKGKVQATPSLKGSKESGMNISQDSLYLDDGTDTIVTDTTEREAIASTSGVNKRRCVASEVETIGCSSDDDSDEEKNRYRKRGRPLKNPSHKGQYTAGKLKKRRIEQRDKANDRLAKDILDISDSMAEVDTTTTRYIRHEKEVGDFLFSLRDCSPKELLATSLEA